MRNMRDMSELKNAFGRADDGFASNVYRTLAGLQINEERYPNEGRYPAKKTVFRMAVAIAAACMLFAGTALAFTNTWGILDFLSVRRDNAKVLPEAAEMVQKELSQKGGRTEFGDFAVREAVFDGKSVFIVMDVKPASPGYLLLGPDAFPSDPISSMGPLFSGKTGTIADYARENNKEMINTSVGIEGVSSCSIDYILEEDGTLVYMLNAGIDSSSAREDINITCVAVPFVNRNGKTVLDDINKKRATVSVTLDNTGTNEIAASTEPVIFTDFGVRVDKVTLNASAMGIYADIEYTVIDREKFAGNESGLFFEFLDDNGDRIPGGISSGGGIQVLDQNRYVRKFSLQASETLPSEITLRAFNPGAGDRHETHVIKMRLIQSR